MQLTEPLQRTQQYLNSLETDNWGFSCCYLAKTRGSFKPQETCESEMALMNILTYFSIKITDPASTFIDYFLT